MKGHHVPTGGHATKDITSVKQVHPVQTEHVVPAKKAHFKNSMGQIRMKENSSLLEKAILINNLMAKSGGGISSQFSSLVTDTKGLIADRLGHPHKEVCL